MNYEELIGFTVILHSSINSKHCISRFVWLRSITNDSFNDCPMGVKNNNCFCKKFKQYRSRCCSFEAKHAKGCTHFRLYGRNMNTNTGSAIPFAVLIHVFSEVNDTVIRILRFPCQKCWDLFYLYFIKNLITPCVWQKRTLQSSLHSL